MSNISDRHNVNPFVAGKSQALTGQRLAKVGYKTTAKNPARFKSVCVSIPYVDTKNDPFLNMRNNGAFDSIIQVALENAQDGIIRSLYESSEGTLSSVSDSDISLINCLAFIEAENNGGRLTKEFLESWFDSTLKDTLTVIFAEKLGFDDMTDEQMIVVEKHLSGYKGLISSLSGGKPILQDTQINSLRKVLELVEDETSLKLKNRLDNMSKKEKIEELLEL